jgi:hypothetical protein
MPPKTSSRAPAQPSTKASAQPAHTPTVRSRTRRPSVTLVLGAGVSTGVVPDWNGLTEALQQAAGGSFPPLDPSGAFPNENQLRLELVWRALVERKRKEAAKQASTKESIGERMLAVERAAEVEWVALLRSELYATRDISGAGAAYASLRMGESNGDHVSCPATTLTALADLLLGDEAAQVERVITFNADDWLEFELCRRLGAKEFHERFRVVVQPTFGPDAARYDSANDDAGSAREQISLVHPHGFLCHPGEKQHPTYSSPASKHARQPSYDAPNMLVFRDLDYWRTAANPTSFANHTLLHAMTTSRCVFVGLSFRDLNLLRWAGALAAEHEDAWRRRWDVHFVSGDESVAEGAAWARRRMGHTWITSGMPSHLEEYLNHRGIALREVSWSEPSTVTAALRSTFGLSTESHSA